MKKGLRKSSNFPIKDLTDLVFTNLLVESWEGRNSKGHNYWKCKCTCGTIKNFRHDTLMNGRAKSCGCYTGLQLKDRVTIHGGSRTPLYSHWLNMKSRCRGASKKDQRNYKKRGILVCREWINSFTNFKSWATGSGYNKNLTLERKDNNRGYSPENCAWETYKVQNSNKRTNHYLTYKEKTMTVTQWAEELGFNPSTLFSRITIGWDIERILTEPNNRYKIQGDGEELDDR